jgi:hypothetical protein
MRTNSQFGQAFAASKIHVPICSSRSEIMQALLCIYYIPHIPNPTTAVEFRPQTQQKTHSVLYTLQADGQVIPCLYADTSTLGLNYTTIFSTTLTAQLPPDHMKQDMVPSRSHNCDGGCRVSI